MTNASDEIQADQDRAAVGAIQAALRLVCVTLPHLAGLARGVRPQVDRRIPTAAVFASGRLLVNPEFILSLQRKEALFVMAHELLHLALRSHERNEGTDPRLFNVAHDYIINDMLRHDLDCPIPAGGLDLEGAREISAEKLVADLNREGKGGQRVRVWRRAEGSGAAGSGGLSTLGALLNEARKKAGLPVEESSSPPEAGADTDVLDVLDEELERDFFPEANSAEQGHQNRKIRELAARADSLRVWMERMNDLQEQSGRGSDPGNMRGLVEALRRHYKPPWELALQRWLEAVAPGPRTFARPSRRQAVQPEVVLPGRQRQGWTLHIVLDTSGSMEGWIPRALGTIADFCAAVGVDEVHLLQCDVDVMKDEWVGPEELARYEVLGYGGSDMTPALEQLTEDPEVQAVVVLTDGDINYPRTAPPYQVLWVLAGGGAEWFKPGYGQTVVM